MVDSEANGSRTAHLEQEASCSLNGSTESPPYQTIVGGQQVRVPSMERIREHEAYYVNFLIEICLC